MRRPLLALLLALAPAAARAQDPSAVVRNLRYAVRPASGADTAMAIEDRMRAYHLPGVSIAIIDGWKVVYARGFGVAEFGTRRAVDTTTLFLAGSISKPVFASGLLTLLDRRRVSLDADVNTLLRSWKLPPSRFTEREKVTLRRILSHTAGLTVWGFAGYEMGAPIPTVTQVLDSLGPANSEAVRSDTTPGARWLYSGGGITIAQLVATDLAGEPFPPLMRRLVLGPAGMAHSTYENPLPPARWAEAATGHEKPDTPVPGHFHVYPEMAAAGLWTTASDLARWAIALSRSVRGEPGGFVPPAMARAMVTAQAQVKPPYGTGSWGLGVAVEGAGDSLSFKHGGRDEGFIADLQMWPHLGRGIVILTNGTAPFLFAEVRRAFAEVYGVGAPARPVRDVRPATAAQLAPLVGRYLEVSGKDSTWFDVKVAPSGTRLDAWSSAAQRALPWAWSGDDRFVNLESGVEWTFERDASGAVTRMSRVGPDGTRRAAERR
jgi:CubicO group peptidase (beta-lactamase class C family)